MRNNELQAEILRLQEENKRLQMLSCANCGEKYLSPDGAELYEKNVQLQKENEELKAENEQLKKPCLIMPKVKQLAVPIEKYEKLYKALEEIREIAKYWLNNDWSCYHCRSNMDEKLKEIIKLTRF